jgi:hypothetical protein
MNMRKWDRTAVMAIATWCMVALSIFFCLKADYRFRHMQKIHVIRLEQVKTDQVKMYDHDGRLAPLNLVMRVSAPPVSGGYWEEKQALRAVAARFDATGYDVAQPGKHPGLPIPKPSPTAKPGGSPAEGPKVAGLLDKILGREPDGPPPPTAKKVASVTVKPIISEILLP